MGVAQIDMFDHAFRLRVAHILSLCVTLKQNAWCNKWICTTATQNALNVKWIYATLRQNARPRGGCSEWLHSHTKWLSAGGLWLGDCKLAGRTQWMTIVFLNN